jgi:serine/threonine protein phosphatase PrpC
VTVHLVEGNCRVLDSQVAYAGATDPGRVRRYNEDNLLILPETGIFAVADGLGGLDAGDIASSTALAHLQALSSASTSLGDGYAKSHLEAIIAAVNSHTYQQRLLLGKNMATTLALVQLGRNGTALAAHVGDSRIYRWHNNELIRITSDHSLVNELYEQGALTASQAERSPQRHVITRAVGAEPTVLPSITAFTVARGDKLLLCTDGLTSMLPDEQIAQCLQSEQKDIGRIVEQLVYLANEAGGHDNITVIVFSIQS